MNSEERELFENLERRLAALEGKIRALETHRVSAESAPVPSTAERPTPPPLAAVPPTPPRPMPAFTDPALAARPKRDWEGLIGRYGTLILGGVAALTAVGTFVGWAIANGLLGPTARVVLGLLAAVALAVWGLKLREKERSFGAAIIGLALAIAHVCAWGAGPALHLVPTSVAFVFAAIASLTLEWFAHREDDEPLWSVGFFGAAMAPFVTSDGSGQLFALASYGVGVLVSAGYALGERAWKVAGRLFVISSAIYVVALATGFESRLGPILAMILPVVVAYLGVLRWTTGQKRRNRLRWLGAFAALAAMRTGAAIGLPMSRPSVATIIAVLGVAWILLVLLTYTLRSDEVAEPGSVDGDRVDAGIIPMAFVVAILLALDSWLAGGGAVLAATTVVLFGTVSRYPAGGLRDGAAVATLTCAVGAIAGATDPHLYETTAGIAVLGAAAQLANRWRPTRWWILPGLLLLFATSFVSLQYLAEIIGYVTPFASHATLVALTVLASWIAAWRLARESELGPAFAGGILAWGFFWVRQELAIAFSSTASTLLLVTYYAASSVAAVGAGRGRGIALLRHVGLAMAVWAAGYALFVAQNLAAVGARIAADLVAAVFLLSIAYWYRAPGARGDATEKREPRRSLV